jgi:hypothetical protein
MGKSLIAENNGTYPGFAVPESHGISSRQYELPPDHLQRRDSSTCSFNPFDGRRVRDWTET